jgi:hypothetical protein
MRTITINFTVTDFQFDVLRWGKCDKPNPERVKRMLLQEAAKNARWLIDSVLKNDPSDPLVADKGPHIKVNTKAELREINRQRRWQDMTPAQRAARDADDSVKDARLSARRARDKKRALKIERADKAWENKTAGEKDPRIGPLGALGLTLSQAKARAAKPMQTDGSAQPEWMDDDNIDKLRS